MRKVLPFLFLGCALIPPRLSLVVDLIPEPSGEGYGTAPDGSATYRAEGVLVKVRYLSDEELNREYAELTFREPNLNPFTYGTWRDVDLGYTPKRFTVFQVEVHNFGRGKVLLDPYRAVLETDLGERLPSWRISKDEGEPNFESYYRALSGPSGNEQYWFRERMGTVRSALYHPGKPVFKGQKYSGKLVFSPLDPRVGGVVLSIPFVLEFDGTGRPRDEVELKFSFKVKQEVLRTEGSVGGS